jgi:hypothetical protein
MTPSWLVRLLFFLLLVAGWGCSERPRAPALEDSTVYQNDQEGFRFLVPEGWSQQSKSAIPPGRLTRELVLVEYRRYQTQPPAALQVSIQDLASDLPLGPLLAGSRAQNTDWHLVGNPVQAKVGVRVGQRFILEGKGPGGPQTREVIAVRKGDRVYFFTGIFNTPDHTSRDLVRQTFANVVWK